MVAEIIINTNAKELDRIFDYNIPKELESVAKIGKRVLIKFGNRKTLDEGFIIGIKENSSYKLKDIEKVQEGFCLSEENINLAKWISKECFANISDCIKLMLPPGTTTNILSNRIKEKTRNFVYLKKDFDEINFDIENKIIKSDKHIRVLNFLKENPEVEITELEMFTETSRAVLKTIEKNGYIEIIEKQVDRNPLKNKRIKRTEKLKLTDEQEKAYLEVLDKIENNQFKEFLLYGVTGSRKNRNIFTINRKSYFKRKESNNASSRNIAYTTNGR